ncbi:monooxygenase [Streptacidiphilus sp. PB12-B1b]|uniref:FAD-dependent monooxygenase n=1 Tax=Streptacidiphilus sp. PB12-B1b TaxID=2705012 RepID=UPI0015FE3238|nr:FAD-dependent monooxygenase [Streptacidiphilus sp. PB12-B1b]QMU79869.1 monooxygenase [Streptacidiphilus sp. PB12-B1b]
MEQIIVAGAGPVGLWLAAELRLYGVPVTVLEARTERDPHSKALTVHPRTLEVLAFRGLAERFLAEGMRIPSGHFAALAERMDFGVLDTPFPFTLSLPQARTEELLEEHARSVGVEVLRGHRVTGLAQDDDAVTVDVDGPDGVHRLRAAYLVGCDGTRSAVRGAAGIDFPGTGATVWAWLGDVVLDQPPARPSVSGPKGALMVFPLPGGLHRLVGNDVDSLHAERPGPLGFEELRANVRKIAGTDFGMRDPRWLSRFGNATRQAERYRDRRVLLAGDAAHMHFPSGGPGLNVGIQDATNLGWKLAATLAGAAPDGLLDSYHGERHPVGADLLLSTRAQTGLMTTYSPEGQALRTLLGHLIATVGDFSKELAERASGLAVGYPAGPDAHPLTGHRVPDLAFGGARDDAGQQQTTLFALLRDGRYLLLDLTGTGRAAAGVERPAREVRPGLAVHSVRLTEGHGRPGWSEARAVLVRPDGHVAWASAERDDDALAAAARAAVAATWRG